MVTPCEGPREAGRRKGRTSRSPQVAATFTLVTSFLPPTFQGLQVLAGLGPVTRRAGRFRRCYERGATGRADAAATRVDDAPRAPAEPERGATVAARRGAAARRTGARVRGSASGPAPGAGGVLRSPDAARGVVRRPPGPGQAPVRASGKHEVGAGDPGGGSEAGGGLRLLPELEGNQAPAWARCAVGSLPASPAGKEGVEVGGWGAGWGAVQKMPDAGSLGFSADPVPLSPANSHFKNNEEIKA